MRLSKIDRLGLEARKAIARWRDGGLTIDAIKSLLEAEFGLAVSRSGLGRHVQEYDLMVREIRASREAAALIAGELGEFSDERIGRFNQEMTESLIAKLFFANRDAAETIDPQALKLISEIQRNLAQAKRQGLEVEKGKARWREEQRQKLAALEAAEAKGGKTDPARLLTRIRAEIYGL